MQFTKTSSDTLDIVLQGGSYGIESPFMQKVITVCEKSGHSVVAFNFPYFERREERSSGPELKEELETLGKVMKDCQAENYQQIRLVAKSMGAIVASFFLRKLSREDQARYSIVVLGYVLGGIDLKSFSGKITVIQGERDRFGGIDKVKEDLRGSVSKKINYFEIKGADHSYRNPETKEPVYEEEVINLLTSLS